MIGWLATVLTAGGSLLLATFPNPILGWWTLSISAVAWCIHAVQRRDRPLFVVSAMMLAINLVGLVRSIP